MDKALSMARYFYGDGGMIRRRRKDGVTVCYIGYLHPDDKKQMVVVGEGEDWPKAIQVFKANRPHGRIVRYLVIDN